MKNESIDPLLRSLPVVSACSLKELAELGEPFFSDLKTTFIEDLLVLFGDIEKALKARDPRDVQRAVHSLRGISSNFGASRLQTLGVEIDRFADAGDWEEAGSLLPRLREAIREVETALSPDGDVSGRQPGDSLC